MRLSRRHAALAAAYIGTFLASLDISIVNVALPTMQSALHTDIAGLQWVINAYAVCLSAFMLSAGPLADRYGHKRVWVSGVILFTCGSVLCGLAPNIGMLLAGRAVQGIGAALLISGAMPILSHAFTDARQRAHAIGGWSAFSALALILGPLLGGILLQWLGWQSIFLVNTPLCLVAIAAGLWGITERKYPEHAAMDKLGQMLGILSLGALAWGMIEAGNYGFSDRLPLIILAFAVAGFILFAMVEMRTPRPLLPLVLLREKAFVIVNLASFILGFSYYSCLFFFSIFLQQIQGWAPVEAGWRMLPLFAVTGLVSLLFGRISLKLPMRELLVIGYGLAGLSMVAMVQIDAETSYWIVGTLFTLLGAGAGLAVPGIGMLVMGMAPTEQAGSVSAMMNALRQAGMTVGIALLGTLMTGRAISTLTASLSTNGIDDAGHIAHLAVTRHIPSTTLADFSFRYTSAMASGFHLAMLCAGGVCLAAMALLMRMKPIKKLG
ncbi:MULTISPECIES: MFS transporter [Rahnella]|uniref:MFS transporter n=1 Tax=Rahnella TaxID=34037 RepID=UPI00224A9FE3|nr:MFS transporter [Rahnella perminowiae]MCX2946257.1 MFS transporter [Rahnella perminowiae]